MKCYYKLKAVMVSMLSVSNKTMTCDCTWKTKIREILVYFYCNTYFYFYLVEKREHHNFLHKSWLPNYVWKIELINTKLFLIDSSNMLVSKVVALSALNQNAIAIESGSSLIVPSPKFDKCQ